MARMLGRVSQPWCPYCHRPPGLDCPVKAMDKRQVRFAEKREWRREAVLSLASRSG